jgi:predicted nuclease of restriction endonuclease-like (RecB) superfamily
MSEEILIRQQAVAKLRDPSQREYSEVLESLKDQIISARIRASFAVNTSLIELYWHLGTEILSRQEQKGWGAKVIEQLAKDLTNSFPEMKGLTRRNLLFMRQFASEYRDFAMVKQLVSQLPWGHNIMLMQRIKDSDERHFYAEKTIENGWSRAVLEHQIESRLFQRQGRALQNFDRTLPAADSDLAKQLFKDPYQFDFLGLAESADERMLEQSLLEKIENFLLELGSGFAFLGSQYHLEVGGQDYYLDLLFYHVKLRSYIVIELKVEEFKPEFAGKMSFYLSAVDDLLREPEDRASIGLILCKSKNNVIVEYALRDSSKPMGVAVYAVRSALPPELRDALPDLQELERIMSEERKTTLTIE